MHVRQVRLEVEDGRAVEHNRVEEQQVYLWPVALLTESELDTLREGMKREIENLPPRFSEGMPR